MMKAYILLLLLLFTALLCSCAHEYKNPVVLADVQQAYNPVVGKVAEGSISSAPTSAVEKAKAFWEVAR
jgi:hypothetical protein